MELRRVLLKDFLRFEYFEAEFTKGLNVVKGPNEAGKSTLHDAIVLGFFDRPTGKQSEQKYKAWNKDNLYVIGLTYVLPDGQDVTIHKDYSYKTHKVIKPDGEDTSREGLEKATLDAAGTLSEKMFISTACIRQDAMPDIHGGRAEISRQLQQIVIGGGESDVGQVIDKLKNEVSEFERGWKTIATKNPGPIKQLQDRINEVTEMLNQIKPQVEQRESAQERLLARQERLGEIENELRPRRQLRDAYETRKTLLEQHVEQRDIEDKLVERLEKVEQAEQARKRALDMLAEMQAFDDLDDRQRNTLNETNRTVQELVAQIAERTEIVRELESQPERTPAHSRLIPASVAAAGIILVIIGILPTPALIRPIGALIAGSGGILVIIGIIWLLYASLRRRPEAQAQLVAAREREKWGQDKLGIARQQLRELLAPLGCETWDDYETKLKTYVGYKEELKTAEATLEGALSTDETLEDLKGKRKEAGRRRWDIEGQLEEQADTPELSPLEYHKLIDKIAALEKEQVECNREILRLEGQREASGYTIEEQHQLEERRASLERQLSIAQERYQIYSLVLGMIRQAREYTMRTAQSELGPRMSIYVKRLTQGRYGEVLVDEDLTLQLNHASKLGDPISPDELSQGTRDQLYLAARLALCDLIFRETWPPLLMDDPFVKFDPNRRDAAMGLCQELAADRQIILFTCHDGYDKYADRVISLEGPET